VNDLNRRQAMKLAATAGAVALAGTAAGADDPPPKNLKANNEPPVEGITNAESYGARELFAVVDWEGKLRRGLHAVSSKSLGVGYYEVVFDRDVRRGAYIATSGGHGYVGVPLAAIANVMGRANNPRAVFVFVADLTGAPLAAGFHLVVTCPEGFA
jgi:hypothetical protein